MTQKATSESSDDQSCGATDLKEVRPMDINAQNDELNLTLAKLREGFEWEQKMLLAKLRSSARIAHHGDKGETNESFFIDFLRCYLPERYTVNKAMVIDSLGARSHSIDIVVYDKHFTPILFDVGHHRYVPAEAVYAVFECKPDFSKETVEYAGNKAASVRQLRRTSINVSHIMGMAEPKKPFHILAGILALDISWTTGLTGTFPAIADSLTGDRKLDCGLAVAGHCFDTFSGSLETKQSEAALVYFALRLLSKLQSMGTVTAVDWNAYAECLSSIPKEVV